MAKQPNPTPVIPPIIAAYDELYKARRPYWILLTPTAGDIKGLIRDAAARAKVNIVTAEVIIAHLRPPPRTARAIV